MDSQMSSSDAVFLSAISAAVTGLDNCTQYHSQFEAKE